MKRSRSTSRRSIRKAEHAVGKAIATGIVATVSGGIFLALILPSARGLLAAVASAGATVFTWAWTPLTASYPIPGWVVIIGGIFVLVALMRFLRKLVAAAPHLGYNEDMIDGAKWRWSWTNKEISRPVGFCPICDAQLVCMEDHFSQNREFVCERCPPDQNLPGLTTFRVVATISANSCYGAHGAIEREILRRARTGEFPQ